MYSPPFGDSHLLSNLPRPAVCSSARTTVPSLAPALPNLSAVSWVEVSLLYSLTFQVMSRLHPVLVRGCARTLKALTTHNPPCARRVIRNEEKSHREIHRGVQHR